MLSVAMTASSISPPLWRMTGTEVNGRAARDHAGLALAPPVRPLERTFDGEDPPGAPRNGTAGTPNSFQVTRNSIRAARNSFPVARNAFPVARNAFLPLPNLNHAAPNPFGVTPNAFRATRNAFPVTRNSFRAVRNAFGAAWGRSTGTPPVLRGGGAAAGGAPHSFRDGKRITAGAAHRHTAPWRRLRLGKNIDTR